jgi:pilus assembly protein FimV
VRKLMLTLAAIGATLPAVGHALGLGEIRVNSALNEPLEAEVDILAARPGEVEELIVSLADADTFRRAGLDRPYVLTKLRFEVERRPGGQPYIKIFTRESVREPFLSFLVEADWAKGRVIREFTILLDPPTLTVQRQLPQSAPVAQPAPAPVAQPTPVPEPVPMAESEPVPMAESEPQPVTALAEPAESAEPGARVAAVPESEPYTEPETAVAPAEAVVMAEPEPMPEQEAAPELQGPPSFDSEATRFPLIPLEGASPVPAAPTYAAPAYTGNEYGPVAEEQTLWSIAGETRLGDDVSMSQMMLAYLRVNPEAFIDGNINRLRKGFVLRVPSRADVTAVGRDEALAEVQAQNGLWREYVARVTGQTYPQATGVQEAAPPGQTSEGADEQLTLLAPKEGGEAESGTQEAGATENLRNKLALSEESLEAARVENQELRERIGMLEEQVAKMQRLIELKQDELAELQMMQRQEQAAEAPAEEAAQAPAEAAAEAPAEAVAEGPAAEPEPAVVTTGEAVEPVEPEAPAEVAEESAAVGEEMTPEEPAAQTVAETPADEPVPPVAAADTEEAEPAVSAQPAEPEPVVEAPETLPEESAESGPEPVVTAAEESPQESPGLIQQYLPFLSSIIPAGAGEMLGSPVTMGAAVGVPLVLLLGGGLVYMRRRQAGEAEVAEAGALSFEDTGDLGEESEDTGLGALPDEGPEMTTLQDITDITAPGGDFTKTELSDEAQASAEADDKDDTVSEVDVYLAYGLHQQAEDLLRDVIKEKPDRKDYRLKLLETHYAAKNKEAFVAEAEALKQMMGDDEGSDWERTLAMGAELAPEHPLFSGADTSKLEAPVVEHARLEETDIGLNEDDTLTRSTDVELEDAFAESQDLSMTQSLDLDEIGALSEGEESTEEATVLEGGLDDLDSTETELLAPEDQTGGGDAAEGESGMEFDLGEIGDMGGEEDALVKTADETPTFEADESVQPEEGSDEFESTMMALPDFELPGEEKSSEVAEAQVDADLTEADLTEPGLDETVALSGGDDSDDLALPDDVDEVGTKLDLAKAFIDMGDTDGARGTLEEVMAEGSDDQKAEAQRLMQQIA